MIVIVAGSYPVVLAAVATRHHWTDGPTVRLAPSGSHRRS
jgi:hypothetical protein